MLKLDTAILRCFDRCNLELEKDDDCIIRNMFRYKAIAQLPPAEFDEVYENLTISLGLRKPARIFPWD